MNKEDILKLCEKINTEMLIVNNIRSIAMISESTMEATLVFTNVDGTTDYYRLSDVILEQKLNNIISKYKQSKRKQKLERIVDGTE